MVEVLPTVRSIDGRDLEERTGDIEDLTDVEDSKMDSLNVIGTTTIGLTDLSVCERLHCFCRPRHWPIISFDVSNVANACFERGRRRRGTSGRAINQ